MEIKKAYAIYLSPTGTTQKVVTAFIAGTGISYEELDLTTPRVRKVFNRSFGKDELVVVGLPVYSSRIPINIDNFFSGLKGSSTPAVAIVVYGNRAYDDALIELKLRLGDNGFEVKVGSAFIGSHTFGEKTFGRNIASGRPDAKDLNVAARFGKETASFIAKDIAGVLKVKGNYPFVSKSYDPSNPEMHLPIYPKIDTNDDCRGCGLCAENCPWEAIDKHDYKLIDSKKCMRCFRCIINCPSSAKHVVMDEKLLAFVSKAKTMPNAQRHDPELFLPQ